MKIIPYDNAYRLEGLTDEFCLMLLWLDEFTPSWSFCDFELNHPYEVGDKPIMSRWDRERDDWHYWRIMKQTDIHSSHSMYICFSNEEDRMFFKLSHL